MATPEIDFAMNFEDNQQSDADKKLFVVFYRDAIQNHSKTVEAGRPIFDDVHMIRIHTPGSRDTLVSVADYGYQQRFARQWAQYEKGIEQTTSGTPLSAVPWLTGAQVAELLAVNIKSVEQLAGMADNVASKFMNHHELKRQAANFLEAAKGAAPMLKMQEELRSRDETISQMQETLKALQTQIDAQKALNKVASKA